MFAKGLQQFSMFNQLAHQLNTCRATVFPTVLKKLLMVKNKLKLKQNQQDLNNIITNRLRSGASQLLQYFDCTFLKYCLRKLGIFSMEPSLAIEYEAGENTVNSWLARNTVVSPKSMAMLPQMSTPCCSDYFLKEFPFCSRQSQQTMPLLVQNYQELSQQKMEGMICALATEGKGVIMIVSEHFNSTPVAGFLRFTQEQYQHIYNLLAKGLQKIKQNEENIKVIVDELPLFGSHEIGQKQGQEEFLIRIIVYVRVCQRKKIFYIESGNQKNSRKSTHFYCISNIHSEEIAVKRICQEEIYDKILYRPRQFTYPLKPHRCLFFQNQQKQIEFKIPNFVPLVPFSKSKKNVKLIKPMIESKTEMKYLTFPATNSNPGMKNNAHKPKYSYPKSYMKQTTKTHLDSQDIKMKFFGGKMNQNIYEDFIY